MDLLDVLTDRDSALDWFVARVERLHPAPGPRLDLVIGDLGDPTAARLRRVPYLATYTPSVGDVVHGISKSNIGALVLGKAAS